jgi:hypothetical protein
MIRIPRNLTSGRILAAAVLMLAASSAHADQGTTWHVDMMSGEATIQSSGAQPIALTPDRTVAPGTVIETGEDGRVVLSRGTESIMISPNSSVAVSPDSDNGPMTRILQRVGTVLLQVDKQDRQHFEVETPYLAAVVKGTKFTVSVDAGGAAVHVMEGVVETIDLDTGDVGMIHPGQTAQTRAGKGNGLTVSGPGVEPVQRGKDIERAQSSPRVAPKSEDGARTAGKPTEIHAERRSVVDVAKSTNGLARGLATNTAGNGRSANAKNDDAGDAPLTHAAASQLAVASAPGLSGSAPGQSATAPGLSGSAPGQSVAAPGLSGAAPGLAGPAPGLSGTLPGASGSAPGLAGVASGLAGSAPGLSGSTPGQSGSAPGQSGTAPGNSGSAPGKNKS